MTIVIVGGGLAGATAATELRQQDAGVEIVLIGAEPHPPYERPPLSKQFLQGKKPFEKAWVHPEQWYADNRIELRQGTTVTDLDLAGRTVRTRDGNGDAGELSYDRLLIATGSSPRRLAMAEPFSPVYLRTVEDSQALRDRLAPNVSVAIVGAGWIGLEVAAAARLAGASVTVFESAELPLLRVLGPEVAQVFADLHRGHGVDLRLSSSITAPDLSPADVVLVGIGAIPDTDLAERAGLATDNGTLVDAALRTSDEHVYAIGDVANHDHPVLGRRIRVEHWDTAIEQGKVSARNLLGANEQYTRQPYFFTDQYDLGMEYVGSVGPDGYDRVDIDGSTDVLNGDAFRAYWVADGRVVAAMHANDWDASDAIRDSIGTAR